MDLISNALWALSQYDKLLINFVELLRCKELSEHEYNIKEMLRGYVTDRAVALGHHQHLQDSDLDRLVADIVPDWQDQRLMHAVIFYAQALSLSGAGGLPLRRVTRILEQDYDQKRIRL